LARTKLIVAAALVLAAPIVYSARHDLAPPVARMLAQEWRVLADDPLPLDVIPQIYDMGVADVDGDGFIDIYTTNHNYRQVLLRSDGKGGYEDVVAAWALDQSRDLPGAEQSMAAPATDKPGLYVYWLGDTLNIVAHRIESLGPVAGSLRIFNLVEVVENSGFDVDDAVQRPEPDKVPETTLRFSAARSAHLVLFPDTRGAPVAFRIDAAWARTGVFVGRMAIAPKSAVVPSSLEQGNGAANTSEAACTGCVAFTFSLRDRHAMAWTDYDGDGRLDVFIDRGALGGTLRMFPEAIRDELGDELLVTGGRERFVDRARELGIEKKDCSGRHARWVDFDHDGMLDLFVNCQDRGNVSGGYPKQLYRQGGDRRFTDVAPAAGLDLAERQLVDFAWFDADGDGRVDLFTHEDAGYFLYRNRGGTFERSDVGRGKFERSDIPGLKGNTEDYWQFDGKLTVADFDADGDLDVFAASKKGNVLLVNDGGKFTSVDPVSIGLPGESVAALWVDYDNDGRPDLHTVPGGIYRQGSDRRFVATGLLALPAMKYMGAIINWFDKDNDGDLDVVIALLENWSHWRWWERPFKSANVKGKDDRFDWKILSYRNHGADARALQLRLVGAPGNPQAIGARVTLTGPASRQVAEVGASEGSNHSQGHYRLHFGLGERQRVDAITVRWPDGKVKELRDVPAGGVLTIAADP
jgi:hypothetical protein